MYNNTNNIILYYLQEYSSDVILSLQEEWALNIDHFHYFFFPKSKNNDNNDT